MVKLSSCPETVEVQHDRVAGPPGIGSTPALLKRWWMPRSAGCRRKVVHRVAVTSRGSITTSPSVRAVSCPRARQMRDFYREDVLKQPRSAPTTNPKKSSRHRRQVSASNAAAHGSCRRCASRAVSVLIFRAPLAERGLFQRAIRGRLKRKVVHPTFNILRDISPGSGWRALR
jgi:hypothetical protein